MFPCNIIKKPAGQTVKSERRLLYFLGYYISLLQTFIDMLSGSGIELAPVSAAAVAARTDKAFSSQNGSSLKSSWYVEPVLSWLSWKMQSSAEISNVLQIW